MDNNNFNNGNLNNNFNNIDLNNNNVNNNLNNVNGNFNYDNSNNNFNNGSTDNNNNNGKKSNTGFIVIIIILLGISGFFGYKYYESLSSSNATNNSNANNNNSSNNTSIDNNTNDDTKKENENKPVNEDNNKQTVPTTTEVSEAIKKDLETKVNKILSSRATKYEENPGMYMAYGFNWNLIFGDISEESKLRTALDTIELKNNDTCPEQTNCTIIAQSNLNTVYKNLFGGQPTNKNTGYNPKYEYEANKQVYYAYSGFGLGIGPEYIYTYINKYEMNNNQINVYLSATNATIDDNLVLYEIVEDTAKKGTRDNFKMYNPDGSTSPKVFETLNIDQNSFKITKDNYTKYNEFKLTFEKDTDGNYIFKTIAKTK